jgi:yeast amino acid transporter
MFFFFLNPSHPTSLSVMLPVASGEDTQSRQAAGSVNMTNLINRSVVIYAGFTIAGPDMIALAMGEIQNPRRTIPRTARLIFYRLVGFYVVGVIAVGIICSSRDTRLLGAIKGGAPGSAASPWVIGIENLGIHGLPDLINFLILLSGW